MTYVAKPGSDVGATHMGIANDNLDIVWIESMDNNDQREAIAQALLSATWPVTDDLERDSLIDALMPLVDAAEQRGYAEGMKVRYGAARIAGKREALAEARKAIEALRNASEHPDDLLLDYDDVLAALDKLQKGTA